jgi:hypothetical protein
VVSNFKGPHDAAGKDVKEELRKQELGGIRTPNAYMGFVNSVTYVEKSTTWKEHENNRDPQLKKKGKNGIDERTCFFIVETEEELEAKSALHPSRIILCDRTNILDTANKKAVKGTTKIHQVCTIQSQEATNIANKEGKVLVAISDCYCACQHCHIGNTHLCKYSGLNNERMEKMKPNREIPSSSFGSESVTKDDIDDDSDDEGDDSDANSDAAFELLS